MRLKHKDLLNMDETNTIYTHEPRIYVSSYGMYNSGSLDGPGWVDLWDFDDKESFIDFCVEKMKALGDDDPELMFQDYEYIPKGLVGESWVSDMIWEIKDEADPEETLEIVEDYSENVGLYKGISLYDIIEKVVYTGDWDDYADELAEEYIATASPEQLASYFDYDMFKRDQKHDYYIGDNHVFRAW